MAKTQCSNCGASLPTETSKCPECGSLQSSRPKMIIGAAGVLIAALAIVLGVTYHRTGSYLAVVLIHMLFNAVNILTMMAEP